MCHDPFPVISINVWRVEKERERERREKTSDTHPRLPSHFWSFPPQLLHDAEGVEEGRVRACLCACMRVLGRGARHAR
jgi:hypothetical protein